MRQALLLCAASAIPLNGYEHLFTRTSTQQSASNEPREEFSPVTSLVPRDNKYALMNFDRRDNIPLATVQLKRGELVGFRREQDQLVAVAGKNSFPVSDGTLAWIIVDEKPDLTSWNNVKKQTTETLENMKDIMEPVLRVVVVVTVVAGVIVGSMACRGDLSGLQIGGS